MNTTTKIALTIAGLLTGYLASQAFKAEAHPPCDAYEPAEVCGYEMEVDPQTGNLESVYVCH